MNQESTRHSQGGTNGPFAHAHANTDHAVSVADQRDTDADAAFDVPVAQPQFDPQPQPDTDTALDVSVPHAQPASEPQPHAHADTDQQQRESDRRSAFLPRQQQQRAADRQPVELSAEQLAAYRSAALNLRDAFDVLSGAFLDTAIAFRHLVAVLGPVSDMHPVRQHEHGGAGAGEQHQSAGEHGKSGGF